ncbi:MAG: sigma-70 family RNA polymerase sigma factor [Bacteroidetes bacterium]|jgi:RNA polymerase sigma factor (TIGR02999 family)|nr:sigma-70 family RNA polymerase sigma factor [Bacteroidota bacterium]
MNHSTTDTNVTSLLQQLEREGTDAYNKLFPLVYNELKDIASIQIASERNDLTLNRTDLVHEVYMKWLQQEELDCNNKKHLMRLASRAMHQILVDYARKKLAAKRGNGAIKVELDEERLHVQEAEEFLELHNACKQLRDIDERLYDIVELKYFSGLSVRQVADTLDISTSTVNRDWKKAKALLFMTLNNSSSA